jgi:dTDP-4-dehydrorhamnose 3,5-epimerase
LAIEGFEIRDFKVHSDDRGELMEFFRSDWKILETPLQWNFVRSKPNALRGVHVHLDHDDYLNVIEGQMLLGLHDIRPQSSTFGMSALVQLDPLKPRAAFVPRGVMHGFYFPVPTAYIYGLTQCWTIADDLGCRWDDPELGIPWPATNPILSDRDRNAISLAELQEKLAGRWEQQIA